MKSENALILNYSVADCYDKKYVILTLQTLRGNLNVSFGINRLNQLLKLLERSYIDELINTPIIIQSVPLGCTVRWIDNFLGFLTDKSFLVNESVDCRVCSYDSSDYVNYCKTLSRSGGGENESKR